MKWFWYFVIDWRCTLRAFRAEKKQICAELIQSCFLCFLSLLVHAHQISEPIFSFLKK